MKQKIGGSSYVAIMESRVTENSANMESWVAQNSTNTENWVMQDSGGREPDEGKHAAPRKRTAPRWHRRGITKTQKNRLQKMRQRELAEKKEEEERECWFNRLWPMT
jgi:pyruvate/2-oxoacid:ferredoxin oxidoreductase beta subunit